MIEFEILSAAEKAQIGAYDHPGHELTMGNLVGDLVIDDPTIGEAQLRASLVENQILVENLNPAVEVSVDGKAVTTPTEIHVGEIIKMGKTTMSFRRFDAEARKPPEAFVHPDASRRFAEGTREQAVLMVLDLLEQNGLPESLGPSAPPPLPPPAKSIVPPPPPVKK